MQWLGWHYFELVATWDLVKLFERCILHGYEPLG